MSTISKEQVSEIDTILSDQSLSFRVMGATRRRGLIEAVSRAYAQEVKNNPNEKPKLSIVMARMGEDKEYTFIPFIFTVFLSWVIQRVLDWLWDHRQQPQT